MKESSNYITERPCITISGPFPSYHAQYQTVPLYRKTVMFLTRLLSVASCGSRRTVVNLKWRLVDLSSKASLVKTFGKADCRLTLVAHLLLTVVRYLGSPHPHPRDLCCTTGHLLQLSILISILHNVWCLRPACAFPTLSSNPSVPDRPGWT